MTSNDYAARFAEYHRRHGRSCEILDGPLWMEYQHMVSPVGPDQADYSIDAAKLKWLQRRFSQTST